MFHGRLAVRTITIAALKPTRASGPGSGIKGRFTKNAAMAVPEVLVEEVQIAAPGPRVAPKPRVMLAIALCPHHALMFPARKK